MGTVFRSTQNSDICRVTGERDAALWRGRFIEEYALAETIVSEALASLAALATEGAESLLPHLVGQRFEALRKMVAPHGPLATQGGRVGTILAEFDAFQQLRAFLCHGSGDVIVDPDGGWQLRLHLLTFVSKKIDRLETCVSHEEAAVMLQRLRSARTRLDGQLRGMLASFRDTNRARASTRSLRRWQKVARAPPA